ncbi:MAG: hypothetical protein HGA19_19540, partial [Oscillochloris sp.]|nr:hypothetical protein [Oscillochloris sp.]
MHELRLDFADNKTAALIEAGRAQALPLRDFLSRFPARATTPIATAWLTLPLSDFRLIPVSLGPHAAPALPPEHHAPTPSEPTNIQPTTRDLHHFPPSLTDSEAVAWAYTDEITKIGRYLSNDLSVLVVCDKVLAEYIYRHAVGQSNKRPLLESDLNGSEGGRSDLALLQRDMLGPNARIAGLSRLLAGIKGDQVLVLRHLDTLAGGSTEGPLTSEARLLTEVLYRSQEFTPTLLGFIDPSLGLP